MSLEISLTGQLAAEADGNRADATHLPGRQASVVFAYLVAERGRPVPSEELAEAVWGGALPPTWRPALRGVVSKVRDFLDRLGLPAADTLTSSSGCYRLVLPPDTAVDVELAEGEAGQAQRALDAGRLDEARGAAERARAIAGRPLLPGHDGAWVQDRRAALHQVLIRSLELLVEIHLAAGQAGQAVGPAGDLVALEPFRASAHRRLLLAHIAAGDRGEACGPTTATGGSWPRSWAWDPPPTWRRPTWNCSTPSRPPATRARRRRARSRAPSWAADRSCAGCAPPGTTPAAAAAGPCWWPARPASARPGW